MELNDVDTKCLLQYIKDVKSGNQTTENVSTVSGILLSLITNLFEDQNREITKLTAELQLKQEVLDKTQTHYSELHEKHATVMKTLSAITEKV